MSEQGKGLHTVYLDADKCKGCINCMKRCPTEAIRVRGGKATVLYDRCIGCGECVRTCPHQAKRAVYDPFDSIHSFKYKVALPAPSLYGQFNNLQSIDYVLEGLLAAGFDDVFEVARAAELVSDITRKYMERFPRRPVISSACPAVVELILIRFHNLEPNLLPLLAPVNVAAKMAREEAVKKTGLAPSEIGVFFISPCPAKVFALKSGLGTKTVQVDGVLAQSEVYFKLLDAMKGIREPRELGKSGIVGIGWAGSGGEAAGVLREKYLAADGIENCISILEEIENDNIKNVDFVELAACPGGCVGGVLNVENPFVARSKIQALRKYLPVSKNHVRDYGHADTYYFWEEKPETMPVFRLDENLHVAMEKMRRAEAILENLPRLDCGACGAPSCRSFAEDVVSGLVSEDGCTRKPQDSDSKRQ